MVIREGFLEEGDCELSLRAGEERASVREWTGCWGSTEVDVEACRGTSVTTLSVPSHPAVLAPSDVTRGPRFSPTGQGRLGLLTALFS